MQALVLVLLLFIVASLGHALSSMTSGPAASLRMVRALSLRVTLSILLFGCLMAGYHFGWISPHGVR